jgi:putative cardiolipin synthase
VVNESLSIVGSSNFDPRSNFLNLEHGLAIESQAFALSLKAQLLEQHESRFWALSFNENDEIIWRKGEQVLDKDPEYPMGRKILDWFVRVIGIEPQV